MNPKIRLYVMGEKGYKVLSSLIHKYRRLIEGVVSAKDKSINDNSYTAIQNICVENNIPFYDRHDTVADHSTHAFVVGWLWLLFLEGVEIIIFHDSPLPKYRGFNPLVSYLLNKETRIGVTALFAHKNFDCGDIIEQHPVDIEYPIKLNDAIQKIIPCYVYLTLKICNTLDAGHVLRGTKQDETEATYSLWRDEADYKIDWCKDSEYIKRFIDSLGFPYKGASTFLNGKKVRVLDAEKFPDVKIENRVPGKVIFKHDNLPVVVCGEGLIKILSIHDDESGKELIPLKRFRSRFGI